MTTRVLAGDIGGTKTALALYVHDRRGALALIREEAFASRRYDGLEAVLAAFLGDDPAPVAAAAFGIAGPVVDDAVRTTNLPWRVERHVLAAALGGAPVRLLNDLEATAYGALLLAPSDLETLNPGRPRTGHRAVIAAGTGLGQAFLFWDGSRHHAVATEGGHVDFAPRDDREVALLAFLRRRHGRVSYERVVSGPGLLNLFTFLVEELGRPVAPEVRARLAHEDPSAVIGEAGVAGACPACREAVEMFVDLYGAQAGNLALTVMATGGVYVGGGIVTKLLPAIRSASFMRSFAAKGRYADLLTEVPVHAILEPRTALLGAAHAARALLG